MSILDRFRLDGRTAILTGVGPGVGEHVAKAYAELGANVVISARSPDRLERIAGRNQPPQFVEVQRPHRGEARPAMSAMGGIERAAEETDARHAAQLA